MKTILILALAVTCGLVSAVETNNVAADPAAPALFMRSISLDGKLFMTNLRKLRPPLQGESDTQLFRRFLKENNVAVEPPRSIYSNNQGFVVYNTLEEVEKLQKAVAKVMSVK